MRALVNLANGNAILDTTVGGPQLEENTSVGGAC